MYMWDFQVGNRFLAFGVRKFTKHRRDPVLAWQHGSSPRAAKLSWAGWHARCGTQIEELCFQHLGELQLELDVPKIFGWEMLGFSCEMPSKHGHTNMIGIHPVKIGQNENTSSKRCQLKPRMVEQTIPGWCIEPFPKVALKIKHTCKPIYNPQQH